MLPLVVAVTGHRDLLAAEIPQIRVRIRQLFSSLREQYPDRRLSVLSPLAEGADLQRERLQIVTSTALDESPSVAPNGSMVLYATKLDGRGILAAVSVDGSVKFKLPSREGDVREPAWSPYLGNP